MKLIKLVTDDGVELDGLHACVDGCTTIIHVHGKCGNFYQNGFLAHMFEVYPAAGINFLSANNRGHDCLAEFYRDGRLFYGGGSVELFEQSLADIEAMIAFARRNSKRVILQGHSHGCEKVLYYALRRQPGLEMILLSPCNSMELQRRYVAPQPLDDFLRMLAQRAEKAPDQWVAAEEYGIRVEGVEYSIPAKYRSLHRWLASPAAQLFDYGSKWERGALGDRCFVYLGASDPLIAAPLELARAGLNHRLKDVVFEIQPDGDHRFSGKHAVVLEAIVQWVQAAANGR